MQEAEIEEDAEAARAVDWDRHAADAAYRAEVAAAKARHDALLAQYQAQQARARMHACMHAPHPGACPPALWVSND
jgi:hypothetical protein